MGGNTREDFGLLKVNIAVLCGQEPLSPPPGTGLRISLSINKPESRWPRNRYTEQAVRRPGF